MPEQQQQNNPFDLGPWDFARAALGGMLLGPLGFAGGLLIDPVNLFNPAAADPSRRNAFAYEEQYPTIEPLGSGQAIEYAHTAGVQPQTFQNIWDILDPMAQRSASVGLEQADYMNRMRQQWFTDWQNMMNNAYGQTSEALTAGIGRFF